MKFYSVLAKSISPYTAGEQPKDKKYIKLNTNENAYPPTPKIKDAINNFDYKELLLYPDPEVTQLKEKLSAMKRLKKENIFFGNGSDEVLSMGIAAFFNKNDTIAFPEITYSFYDVYADYYSLKKLKIPLRNYLVDINDYIDIDCKGILLANPNAPTGSALTTNEVEKILKSNREKIIIIDQAYIAFGKDCQADKLINDYDNLLIVETLSKSYSLAGIRLGYAMGNPDLIKALEKIKNSINNYTINRLTIEVALAALQDQDYYEKVTKKIVDTRKRVFEEVSSMGLFVVNSQANFLFIKVPNAKEVYIELKHRGILVRYFDKQDVNQFIRVTIGKDKDMDAFLLNLKEILAQNSKKST